MIEVISEIGASTAGIGVVSLDYNINGIEDDDGYQNIDAICTVDFHCNLAVNSEIGTANDSQCNVVLDFAIAGISEIGSSIDAQIDVDHPSDITCISEIALGSGQYYPNYSDDRFRPGICTVSLDHSIQVVSETGTATDATGVVNFGDPVIRSEVATAIEGVATVELIPTLDGNLTQATIAQIYEQWAVRLIDPVSVTFNTVDYDQACDKNTLSVMQDIVDNWSSYADLKSGSNIEWGVLDGTVLTMTQSEFSTYNTDTLTAWRDQVDRVTSKARDWAENGVVLSVITDASNWS